MCSLHYAARLNSGVSAQSMDILAVAALFGVSLVAAAANKLVRTSRNVERDPAGNPTLKHLYVQYVLACGSAALLAVAAWQFAEPSVRHDMDSVALFVITPVIFGLLAAAASLMAFNYRVTLKSTEIIVTELGKEELYPLRSLEKIDRYENKMTLFFSDGRRLTLHKDLSGYENFVAALER